MSGPMDGVKVVEIGVWVAGPAAAGILADWGADVVKIEPPGLGDPARSFSKMLGGDLPFNPPFEMDNRNKRSIVIDLREDEGLALAHELLAEADVFVTNLRLQALEKYGLDPVTLSERYPKLVYGMITGCGMAGEDRDRAAYDIAAFWARSGVAGMLTSPGHHPPFQRGGMGDHGTGVSAVAAISAALYSREKTGNGQVVSTSLLRQGLYTLSFDLASALRFGVPLAIADRTSMGNVSINNYQDQDGRWFWLVGLDADRHWPPLARCVGRPEWLDDPRFATMVGRAQHASEIIAELDAIFATKTITEWALVFDAEVDMWWAPVQSLDEVIADPQVTAAGGFIEVPDGEATTTLPATPADFAGTPCSPRWMAPDPGQHTDEVLGDLGCDASRIATLREQGVVA
jgi:crotonobetainyl-CoA:carnitine CoA-transferase CaiB-like acyl-CoA transferase